MLSYNGAGRQGHHNMATPDRSTLFISYSHKDTAWLDRLKVHLDPYFADGKWGEVQIWEDTQIPPGAGWKQDIDGAMADAKVAVLLVSADFFASKFIKTEELPNLVAA